jgi:hypothetical protein
MTHMLLIYIKHQTHLSFIGFKMNKSRAFDVIFLCQNLNI